MNHDELQDLLGAYALDALDPEEAIVLASHLAECPRCRAEAIAHQEVAALLASAGGEAPSGLWDRIAQELSSAPASRDVGRHGLVAIRWRRRLPRPVLAALATAAAIVIGLLSVSTIRLQHRVDSLRHTVARGGLAQAASAAVLDPLHTTIELTSAGGQQRVQVIIRPDGEAYLVNGGLPGLGGGRTYQLWGLDDGRAVSLGLLGADPDVVAFHVDSAVSRLMVTAEPEGGRAAPDSQVLVQGARPA